MAPRYMSSEERDALLADLGAMPSDADAQDDRVFLPLPRHQLVFDAGNFVVRGDRGSGKTELFRFVTSHRTKQQVIREVFPNSQLVASQWIDGFSALDKQHPATINIEDFFRHVDGMELRVFWMAHLACCVHRAGLAHTEPPVSIWQAWWENPSDIRSWVSPAKAQLHELTNWLDRLDQHVAGSEQAIVVMYDQLDRIAPRNRELGIRGTTALLELWMSLASRYQRIFPKVFVREDFFEAALRAFADSSKLRSRSIVLDWDRQSLYRVLIRHMAIRSEKMRDWLQRGKNKIPLTSNLHLGWMPPKVLPEEGRVSQKAFVDHLAGEMMGRGVKKGYTHNWIPNRLQDAHVRIVPRSLINLIAIAAETARNRGPKASYDRLLAPEELHAALDETSQQRVRELEEDHPVVRRLANLRGKTVMLEAAEVIADLARPPDEDDGFGDDGQRVLDEFVRLGVLSRRVDGRIDVPDIYRYGYGIKRKGGVARPR